MVNGHCDEKFSELKKILEQQLNSDFELGASVAVEWKGKEVVNLYGGYKDENKNSKWNENTIVNVFSVTKAISGICITRLIDAGLLDVNKNVGHYWPEYACNGKENTKVIDFLTHRAGMFGFENDIPQASWNDWDVYVKALEKQKPFVTPGSSQGYHAVTFAWLVGELFKRVEGRTIGTYFKEEIAEPLDIDFHIGLNEDQINRCASITSFDRLDSIKPPIDFIKFIPNFGSGILSFTSGILPLIFDISPPTVSVSSSNSILEKSTPNALSKSIIFVLASTNKPPFSKVVIKGFSFESCSSSISPTISSTRSSIVTIPSVPPCSSTIIAK